MSTQPQPPFSIPARSDPAPPAGLSISLDIARGLAALSVFFFHISSNIAQVWPALGAFAQHGFLGVPIFFVISGYCMAASAQQVIRRKQSAAAFLRKRFLRIYPAFWASIAVIMAIPYLLEGLSALRTGAYVTPSPGWLALDAVDWLQIVTLSRVFFSDGQGLARAFNSLNIVYWTLAIEFQFYVVMYLALVWRTRFVPILTLVTLASLMVFVWPGIRETGLFLGFWPMFALGLGLYHLLDRNYSLHAWRGVHGQWLAICLLIIGVALILYLTQTGSLEWLLKSLFGDEAFGFSVLTALTLWLVATVDPFFSRHAKNGPVLLRLPLRAGIFLGSISYSIYLLHTKVYQFPEMAARQMLSPDSPLYVLALVGGTIALSWIFHVYFERPFISRRRAPLPLQAQPA